MAQHVLRRLPRLALALFAVSLLSFSALAQVSTEPSILSDQKPGSILFFNRYTSNPSNPQASDTQVNITNTHQTLGVEVHLFFIDGSSCSPADAFISLTPNQTASFLVSDFDPGVQGYLVAVASSGFTPTKFNFLIGDAQLRENDGKLANLPAVSVAKISAGSVASNGDGTASLVFNGTEYDRLPSTVAVSSFNSQLTDSTNLVIYVPSGNLALGGVTSTTVFTLLYDDVENVFSTSFRIQCVGNIPLTSLRVLGGGINKVVPAGRTGWIRMSASGRPLLGAVLSQGPVFNGGHNFHHLALLNTYTILVPAF
jgi:hypothetical protein